MTISPTRQRSDRPGLLARHPLTAFFVMAYAFSWIVWSPWVLGQDGAGLLPVRIDPGVVGYLNAAAILAGPTLAGLIMAAATDGASSGVSCCGGSGCTGTSSPCSGSRS
jgi:hypothetical protein